MEPYTPPRIDRDPARRAAGSSPSRHPGPVAEVVHLGDAPVHRLPPLPADPGLTPCLAAPPVERTPMAPKPWGELNPVKRWLRKKVADDLPPADAPRPWQHGGNVRRLVLLLLMLGQSALATHFMRNVMPYQGTTGLEIAQLALFALLFCWVSAGFWTAMAGFLVLARGDDPYSISRAQRGDPAAPIAANARTAIVMPICNEDVVRVTAGLRATFESLQKTGAIERFDFYILSDSNQSDICSAELTAWQSLCRAVDGFGRVFYRRRTRRVKRKSGNIDDFCRRWGSKYRYMIVLDADSVMSGSCLTALVRLMEANPQAGIIQTAPQAAGRDTLYARIQQFSSRVYGPLFTAGLHYWQLGESHYWGHNAIIRMAPFMQHCTLAPLPGRGPLAGEIMSHDFVEAALMRRAGWAVWIAYDLEGSYEEMPPNLLDELKRDRRWCQGNLMNFRLFAAKGMHPVHRTVFVTGVMAYASAPLWFLFLVLSTAMLAMHTLVEPQYFVEPRQLFPIWPQWHPEKALALITATATVLWLPKLLAVLLICVRGARAFGGRLRILLSMILEMLFSMLAAPVRMLFHTHFVVASLLGWGIRWRSPPRDDSQTGWIEAIRQHGSHSLLGAGWAAGVYVLNPSFLPWLLPVTGALALSVPLSVLSSSVRSGRAMRRAGLFLIPEEANPPSELVATAEHIRNAPKPTDWPAAVVDAEANAVVCAAARPHPGLPASARWYRVTVARKALESGHESLTDAQKTMLLGDPIALARLHLDVLGSERAHASWRAAT